LPPIPLDGSKAVRNTSRAGTGRPVTIGAGGFAPGATTTVSFRGRRVGRAVAGAHGEVVATVTLPRSRFGTGSGVLSVRGPAGGSTTGTAATSVTRSLRTTVRIVG
jgi:hypothetical protein